MANTALFQFVDTNRKELILRCRAKAAARSSHPARKRDDHGVSVFLEHLIVELREGPSQTTGMAEAAGRHGRDLFERGFTVGDVVNEYGDICQSVTGLAVDMNVSFPVKDLRTFNRCLDDATAVALTGHVFQDQAVRDRQSGEMRELINIAISWFETLQAGIVAPSGRPGTVIHAILTKIRALNERPGPLTSRAPSSGA